MIEKPLVVVAGAGASFDSYGLPLGPKLAADVAQATDFWWGDTFSHRPSRGDADFFEAVIWRNFQRDTQRLNAYTAAGQRLAAALGSTPSIDDALYLLSECPEAVDLGKLAIMRAIQAAEADSKLKIKPETGQPDPAAGREGWIEVIFSMAITNLKLSEIKRAFTNITFVIFNYDRCIEHYLFWSLQRIGLDDRQAAEIVRDLKIIRPYGGLGTILPGDPAYLPFGNKRLLGFEHIKQIRTFTESEVLHDKRELTTIIAKASMILFLGFGFHPQNVELLARDPEATVENPLVLATVKGVNQANLPTLRTSVSSKMRIIREEIQTHNMGAAEMLKELRMMITAALS